MRAQLRVDPFGVVTDGMRAETEMRGDSAVRKALGQQQSNFRLASGQPVSLLKGPMRREHRRGALDGNEDGAVETDDARPQQTRSQDVLSARCVQASQSARSDRGPRTG